MKMTLAIAILYIAAVVLLLLVAFGVAANRVALTVLAYACALLAFSLPAINAGIH